MDTYSNTEVKVVKLKDDNHLIVTHTQNKKKKAPTTCFKSNHDRVSSTFS